MGSGRRVGWYQSWTIWTVLFLLLGKFDMSINYIYTFANNKKKVLTEFFNYGDNGTLSRHKVSDYKI